MSEKKYREKEVIGMIAGQHQKIVSCQKKIEEAHQKIEELTLILADIQAAKKATIEIPKSEIPDQHSYCGKILYGSQSEADKARNLINRDLKKVGKDLIKRSYFCAACEAWHVTTIEKWTQPVLEEKGNG